jgi:FAD-dependent oxidoreductase domain-containing protein 1
MGIRQTADMEHVDIAIIGGGVVGSATAYYLKKNGFVGSVAIIEKDTTYQFGCTGRSLGGIRQQFSTPENIKLSLFSLNLIRNLKQEFGPEADVSFHENGYLMMASENDLSTLEENHRTQMAYGADNIIIKGADLAARFSWIMDEGVAGGCFGLSGEGWLDPYSLMTLLRKSAISMGAKIIPHEVKVIGEKAKSITLSNGETLNCTRLVNAAGTAAGHVAGLAGIPLPVGPRKRYVYLLDCPEATEALHSAPLTVEPTGVYFRPEGRNFLCGRCPVEHEEPTDMNWDVDYGFFEERIWPVLAERVPQFETIKVINAWVGQYDYNALDQNAVLGAHPELKNFYFANGFSGHGLQQGPAAGNAIAELIMHGTYRTIDLTRFGYERIARQEPLFEKNVI